MNKIELTWVEWGWPNGGIGRWNAHLLFPNSGRTACGISTALGKGVREIGKFAADSRPSLRCCRECLSLRKALADHIRLGSWNEAAVAVEGIDQ